MARESSPRDAGSSTPRVAAMVAARDARRHGEASCRAVRCDRARARRALGVADFSAEVALGVADGPYLGREARGVIAEVVGQEFARSARRKPDAQRDRDGAPVLERRARANEKRLVGSRARKRAVLLQARQEYPDLPLEIGRELV